MDLPTMISDTFTKTTSGILAPLVSGIGQLVPFLIVLAAISAICLLIFSNRKAPAIATLVICLVITIIYGNIDGWFDALFSWYGADSITNSDAYESISGGFDSGTADTLDSLKDQQ